jgi:hypothetical protein
VLLLEADRQNVLKIIACVPAHAAQEIPVGRCQLLADNGDYTYMRDSYRWNTVDMVTTIMTAGIGLPSRWTGNTFSRDRIPIVACAYHRGGIWLGETIHEAYLSGYPLDDRRPCHSTSHNAQNSH